MNWFNQVDWASVFLPDKPLLEIFVRGTVVYLALFILLRAILKRQWGSVGVTDVLVIVLIADASQNAMASDYKAIPDGILLVATIMFWSFALDWLSFHVPWLDRYITPAPLDLVRNGKMLLKHMRQELITKDDLMSQLREHGVSDISLVKEAKMESDGQISVVTYEQNENTKPRKKGVTS